MKAKTLMIAGLCALVAALALPAGSIGAIPPTVIHWHFTVSFPDDFNGCGIDGTTVFTATGVVQIDASGAVLGFGEVSGIFTSSQSGKSIRFQTAELEKLPPIDNGNGTLTLALHGAGLINKVSVLNGPTLGAIAGERDLLLTFDAATGIPISVQVLHTGGSSGLVGCDVIVPALT